MCRLRSGATHRPRCRRGAASRARAPPHLRLHQHRRVCRRQSAERRIGVRVAQARRGRRARVPPKARTALGVAAPARPPRVAQVAARLGANAVHRCRGRGATHQCHVPAAQRARVVLRLERGCELRPKRGRVVAHIAPASQRPRAARRHPVRDERPPRRKPLQLCSTLPWSCECLLVPRDGGHAERSTAFVY